MSKPRWRTVRLVSAILTIALAVVWLTSGFGVFYASTRGATLTVLHGTIGGGWLPPRDRIDESFWFNDGDYSLRWWIRTPGSRGVFVHFPLWPAVLAGLGITLLAAHKGRRIPPGCCQTCGFDLTGLPPAARCPECGAGRIAAPSLAGPENEAESPERARENNTTQHRE